MPKEQKIYSGTPVNPEYAISKTYGTEKEKDVFAVLKGMDEVTGKDDAGRYLRGRTEWISNENRYLSVVNNNAERKVSGYSKNNPDDMENSGYSELRLLSASEALSDNKLEIGKKIDEAFKEEQMTPLLGDEYSFSILRSMQESYKKKMKLNYDGMVKKYGKDNIDRLYGIMYDTRNSEEFNADFYNGILLPKGSEMKYINKNYTEITKRPISYAIARLIEIKIEYERTDNPINRRVCAEAGNI